MKKIIPALAVSAFLAAGTAIPVYGSGLDGFLSGITGAILNGGQQEEPAPAAGAGDSSQSEGPAPNSGDGVSDGSGQTSPYGPKKNP